MRQGNAPTRNSIQRFKTDQYYLSVTLLITTYRLLRQLNDVHSDKGMTAGDHYTFLCDMTWQIFAEKFPVFETIKEQLGQLRSSFCLTLGVGRIKASLLRSRSGRTHATLPLPTRLLQTDMHSFCFAVLFARTNEPRLFVIVYAAPITGEVKATHWSVYSEKGMHVDLKQPRGDGERCVTPARAASKETT